MKKILVGYTGFVGSNLTQSCSFDGLYNSSNIEEAFGQNPDLLVYSGVPAQKFLANNEPEKDFNIIKNAIDNINRINPKKIVLISTIDIYKEPMNVDEDDVIIEDNLQPYGKNRRYLEKWIQDKFDDYLIVRLPGLYGKNIKKNFIYDIIKFIPSMLKNEKYNELVIKNGLIKDFYFNQNNGFYKCKDLNSEEEIQLKKYFKDVGFSSLNFTDSRGVFQFYNLKYLWDHIEIALQNNIRVLNLATEPIKISELYRYIYDDDFVNELPKDVPYYNFKTKYSELFGGSNGYIFNKKFILEDIKNFVLNYSKNSIKLSISNIAWDTKDNHVMYKILKEKNYNGIEIAPTKLVELNPYDNLEKASEISKLIKQKYNLNISSMQSIWFGKNGNMFESKEKFIEFLNYTKKAIEFASAINCPNIVFGCPKNRNMSDYEKDYEIALQFFKEIGEYANLKNIVISLEPNPKIYNTNFLNYTKDAIEFVKKLNMESIKVNFDFGTFIVNGEDINLLKENLEYINHIHISEPNLVKILRRKEHEEMFEILKYLGYDKYVSIEMKQCCTIDQIREILDYVKESMEDKVNVYKH